MTVDACQTFHLTEPGGGVGVGDRMCLLRIGSEKVNTRASDPGHPSPFSEAILNASFIAF